MYDSHYIIEHTELDGIGECNCANVKHRNVFLLHFTLIQSIAVIYTCIFSSAHMYVFKCFETELHLIFHFCELCVYKIESIKFNISAAHTRAQIRTNRDAHWTVCTWFSTNWSERFDVCNEIMIAARAVIKLKELLKRIQRVYVCFYWTHIFLIDSLSTFHSHPRGNGRAVSFFHHSEFRH